MMLLNIFNFELSLTTVDGADWILENGQWWDDSIMLYVGETLQFYIILTSVKVLHNFIQGVNNTTSTSNVDVDGVWVLVLRFQLQLE